MCYVVLYCVYLISLTCVLFREFRLLFDAEDVTRRFLCGAKWLPRHQVLCGTRGQAKRGAGTQDANSAAPEANLRWLHGPLLYVVHLPRDLFECKKGLRCCRLYGSLFTGVLTDFRINIHMDLHTDVRTDFRTDVRREVRSDVFSPNVSRTDIRSDVRTDVHMDVLTDVHSDVRKDVCIRMSIRTFAGTSIHTTVRTSVRTTGRTTGLTTVWKVLTLRR